MGTAANSPEIPGVGMEEGAGWNRAELCPPGSEETVLQQGGQMLLLRDPSGVARPFLRGHHGVPVKLGSLEL